MRFATSFDGICKPPAALYLSRNTDAMVVIYGMVYEMVTIEFVRIGLIHDRNRTKGIT